MPYTIEDVENLRPRWRETFNVEMPFGFEISLEDVPVLVECLHTKSRKPLERHLETLDLENKLY